MLLGLGGQGSWAGPAWLGGPRVLGRAGLVLHYFNIMVLLYIIFSFDNMFQNAFKCDMVSTTCSKMPSNATWFRQHVPKCSQVRHGFDNMFQTYQTYQPTNLPTYTYIYIYFLCMHNTLVHAQHSCACTGGARAQGQDPTKKRPYKCRLVGW